LWREINSDNFSTISTVRKVLEEVVTQPEQGSASACDLALL
jgi:hypothetical protein